MAPDDGRRPGLAWAAFLIENACEEPPAFMTRVPPRVITPAINPKTTTPGLGLSEDAAARGRRGR